MKQTAWVSLAVSAVVLVGSFVPDLPAAWATDPTPGVPTSSPAVEFRFTPTKRVQMAIWIEKPDGTFMGTVKLTQAVALHGIGNRPGASQMNSGFRWPYGRRIDVLPVWAHRRAAAPGAAQFKQVIFQHRTSEGCASNAGCGGSDSSTESYFCLSFNQATTRQDALDAVSCASVFSSDKGRYVTASDVALGYAEPAEISGSGMMRPLDVTSLYPPRRDRAGCATQVNCIDHADVATYADHVHAVMPDIDTVTMATPPADQEQAVMFTIPADWTDTDYVAWVEVNVEGDHNSVFSEDTYGVPALPAGAWDSWAMGFGYPYRGQPSVLYRLPFSLLSSGTFATSLPEGYGSVDGFGPTGGDLHPMDGTITDDPSNAATVGSGADRLRLVAPRDYRFQANVRDVDFCLTHNPPALPSGTKVTNQDVDEKHSHEWGSLIFNVPASDRPIAHYEVRYSKTETAPIVAGDLSTFERALPALAAKIDSEALMVDTTGKPGTSVTTMLGGLEPLTRYDVAIRAVDVCNVPGPFAVAEFETTKINFTKLAGCFIATAAYGSPLEPEVGALRNVRDVLRPRSSLFAAATDLYYRSGPAAAAVIARSDAARALVRAMLGPAVDVARAAAPIIGR